jgi:hypothetical protein
MRYLIFILLLTSCGPTVLVPMQRNIVVREEVYAKSIRNMQKVKEVQLNGQIEANFSNARLKTDRLRFALEERETSNSFEYEIHIWPVLYEDQPNINYKEGWWICNRSEWVDGYIPPKSRYHQDTVTIESVVSSSFCKHDKIQEARDLLQIEDPQFIRIFEDIFTDVHASEFIEVNADSIKLYKFKGEQTKTPISEFFKNAIMTDLYLEELEDRLKRRKNELINTKVKLTKYRIEGKNITKLLAKETNLEESIKMLNIKIKNHKSKNDE